MSRADEDLQVSDFCTNEQDISCAYLVQYVTLSAAPVERTQWTHEGQEDAACTRSYAALRRLSKRCIPVPANKRTLVLVVGGWTETYSIREQARVSD
jgi:hypothetical protein